MADNEGQQTEATSKTVAPKKTGGFVVAPGKSVTSRRGIIEEGQPIEPKDLSEDLKVGAESLAELERIESVVKA